MINSIPMYLLLKQMIRIVFAQEHQPQRCGCRANIRAGHFTACSEQWVVLSSILLVIERVFSR